MMQVKWRTVGLMLGALLVMVSCSSREPRLLNLGAGQDSPDEFSVLPGKPLDTPRDYTTLPEPTPGGGNITDPTPHGDATKALGGNPAVLTRSGIAAGESALLTSSTRYGVQTDIRETLAAADLSFRKRRDAIFIQRWFSKNRYFSAYRSQSLDKYEELQRLRAAGVQTPTASPK